MMGGRRVGLRGWFRGSYQIEKKIHGEDQTEAARRYIAWFAYPNSRLYRRSASTKVDMLNRHMPCRSEVGNKLKYARNMHGQPKPEYNSTLVISTPRLSNLQTSCLYTHQHISLHSLLVKKRTYQADTAV